MDHNQQKQVMAALNCGVNGMTINYSNQAQAGITSASYTIGGATAGGNSIGNSTGQAVYYSDTSGTLWNYWQNQYYPYVIRESYPIYIQDKAMDKGKHAFELLKALMDKGLVKVDKVKDFIEAMDTILKTL